ncbi:uncharacterized protein [Dysidea avara]|uniref:uncharacterized protein n=1 Tax=Dysidea avara TaxID=196820 RepID=UPI0033239E2E
MATNKSSGDTFLFSSESVGEGHPDKVCDQISDAVLDACLQQDPSSKVACECATKSNLVMVFGEITSKAKLDYVKIVKDTLQQIGYDDEEHGIDYRTCQVLVAIHQQSPHISQKVHEGKADEDIGAGDQGLMFGYATREDEELMPLSLTLAHKLNKKMSDCRRDGTMPWLRPDTKTQVTVEYSRQDRLYIPKRIHTVVISCMHEKGFPLDQQRKQLKEKIVDTVIPANLLDDKTIYHLQPGGEFVMGGPKADAGLTGRKIIVDTYGGWGAHGGGAFSGKDPSKVDRSACYAARWIAKSLVHAKLAKRLLVQVSYAIAHAEPLAIYVDSYGTSEKTDEELIAIIRKNFDLRPGVITKELQLQKPIYQKTACYGHFGRDPEVFPWEKPKPLVL